MPVNIDDKLIRLVDPYLRNLILNNEEKKQFLINISYCFKSNKELLQNLEKFTIDGNARYFLSSAEYEVFFKDKLLDFNKVNSLNVSQSYLIRLFPKDWISQEVIKLIFCDINNVEDFKNLLADLNKHKSHKTESHWNIIGLFIAAVQGHVEVVNELLAAGIDPNIELSDKSTPLYVAAQFDQVKVVKLLLAAGADPNKVTNKGHTPLSVAKKSGNLEVLKLLISAGADPSKRSKHVLGPLTYNMDFMSVEALNILLAAGGRSKSNRLYW